MRMIIPACLAILAGCSAATHGAPRSADEFQRELDKLRTRHNIPGMSAIVDGPAGTISEAYLGLADVKANRPVSATTLFHLASLTKPFGAVIAMQLEQEGLLDLNGAASRFGIALANTDTIRLWHLLSHTSESTTPGSAYAYNGNRYGTIQRAFNQVTGQSFAMLFDTRIRRVLGLESTVPYPGAAVAFAQLGLDSTAFLARMAQGYTYVEKGSPAAVAYEKSFNPAAGLVSTPRDMVKFSRALDDGVLLSAASRAKMWTPVGTPTGRTLPYALGWFVQTIHGETVVWHYGLWTGASALIVKVPARRLTFVVLANSPGLSQPFALGIGDLTKSPFAMLFLRTFMDDGRI